MTFAQSDPLERADVAAAVDGRTPLNRYGVLTPGNLPPGHESRRDD